QSLHPACPASLLSEVTLLFFCNATTPPHISTLSLHDALPIFPSTFKRPVSSWKALNLRKTLLMASSVRLKPLNCSRKFSAFHDEDRKSGSAGMPRPISYAVFCLKKKRTQKDISHSPHEVTNKP